MPGLTARAKKREETRVYLDVGRVFVPASEGTLRRVVPPLS